MLDDIAISLRRIADALERIELLLRPLVAPNERHEEVEQDDDDDLDIEEECPVTLSAQVYSANYANQILIQKALNWFAHFGCTVGSYRVVSAEKEPWDWIAMFLGQRFNHLQDFYEEWKRAINTKYLFTISLNTQNNQKISDNVQFAIRLKEFALINDYKYNRNLRELTVYPIVRPEVINFVTGGWFEYYISRIMLNIATISNLNLHNFVIMRNVQINLPNQQNTELDFLIINNSQKIWIECTTSRYQYSIDRWKLISRYIQIPRKHKIGIVLKSIRDHIAKNSAEENADITILNLHDAIGFLQFALNHH